MKKSKDEYKKNIQTLVFRYQKNMETKRQGYENELVNEVTDFIMYGSMIEDESCKPYLINAMGVMSDENKCTIANTLLGKIGRDREFNEKINDMYEIAMATLYIHSSMDITKMSDDELKVLKSIPMGQEYIEYSNEIMELDERNRLVNSVKRAVEHYNQYIV